jgi:hypothetical protein
MNGDLSEGSERTWHGRQQTYDAGDDEENEMSWGHCRNGEAAMKKRTERKERIPGRIPDPA